MDKAEIEKELVEANKSLPEGTGNFTKEDIKLKLKISNHISKIKKLMGSRQGVTVVTFKCHNEVFISEYRGDFNSQSIDLAKKALNAAFDSWKPKTEEVKP